MPASGLLARFAAVAILLVPFTLSNVVDKRDDDDVSFVIVGQDICPDLKISRTAS